VPGIGLHPGLVFQERAYLNAEKGCFLAVSFKKRMYQKINF